MRAPGLILGRSITGTSGGRMLETLTRLMLPMPAASSALSKALRAVPPSACPAVAAAIVIRFVIRSLLPLSAFSPSRRRAPAAHCRPLYERDARMQEKSYVERRAAGMKAPHDRTPLRRRTP